MSQSYRVKVKESLKDTVRAGRQWRSRVQILDILPREEMSALIARELESQGWEKIDKKVEKKQENWTFVLDPLTLLISVDYEFEKEIEKTFDGEVDSYSSMDSYQDAEKHAKESTIGHLINEIAMEKKSLEKEIASRIDELETQWNEILETELKEVMNRVHVEALKQKASSLGRVESVQENENRSEVTIRIRV